jgi:nitrate reductase delta subunit
MRMLGPARKSPERLDALDRVREWTRERFKLPRESAIHVWELACAVPGCPPVETVSVFWIAERRHQFKVFKPVEEVVRDDLPPAWFKDALAVAEGLDCDCC